MRGAASRSSPNRITFTTSCSLQSHHLILCCTLEKILICLAKVTIVASVLCCPIDSETTSPPRLAGSALDCSTVNALFLCALKLPSTLVSLCLLPRSFILESAQQNFQRIRAFNPSSSIASHSWGARPASKRSPPAFTCSPDHDHLCLTSHALTSEAPLHLNPRYTSSLTENCLALSRQPPR